MQKDYVVVEVFAGNWRPDGRTSEKPRAACWGIGHKVAMQGHRDAIAARYCEANRQTEQELNVVIEVLTWKQANARYTLYT